MALMRCPVCRSVVAVELECCRFCGCELWPRREEEGRWLDAGQRTDPPAPAQSLVERLRRLLHGG